MTPLIIYICVNISYCLIMDNNEQYLAACINLIIFNNVEHIILAFICSIF